MRKTKLLLLVVAVLLPVSVGALGQVWLTVDEKDLERVVQSPEVMQSVGLEKLEDVRKWMENIQ